MSNFFENDDDVFTGKDHTPLREDAFVKTPEEKIKIIEEKFAEIMHTLGLDMTDDSLKDSPKRVAKMYVNEIFGGLLPENKPLDNKLIVFGEVGLAGEVRPVQGGQVRLKEAAKLGFTRAIVPKANAPKQPVDGIEVIGVERLEQALNHVRNH